MELTHAFLKRSGEHYLNIWADRYAPVVNKHASKARVLELRLSSIFDMNGIISCPLPNLRWLKCLFYHSSTLDASLLGGACDLLTTLQAWINLLESTPALESLTVKQIRFTGLNDNSNVGDASYAASKSISLPALRNFQIEGDVLRVCPCLRSLPQPAYQLMVSLSNKELTHRHIVCYDEVFELICRFWRHKTGHASPPPGRYVYTLHSLPYVQFESPDRVNGSPAVLFRATAGANHAYAFWSNVQTLILESRGSSKILLDNDLCRLSGLRSIVINVLSPLDSDEKNIRE
jgi:hypothetical protein